MIYYGIIDKTTNNRWSRNGWRTPTSCPDLYRTRANAQRQIDKGKISIMVTYLPHLNPKVVKYDVKEIKE